ncbi:MAG: hypothetical protein V3S55_06385 [Nitrospiraceae bacterium]
MFQETNKSLLRPRQTEKLREDVERLKQMLSAPPHIANRIEDRGQLTKNLRAAEHDLQTQAPTAYGEDELDAATKRSAELHDKMLEGMPTQAEMRRNPPGAVDKHRRWERRNKVLLGEWKNIQLRLHQNGYGDLPDATDLANFERFRPAGGPGEMNMDNAQIPGKDYHLPPPGASPAAVMSDEQAGVLKEINPELHGKMALLDNDQRAEVLGMVDNLIAAPPIEEKPKPKGMSPEARAAASERMKAMHAKRRAAKEAGE